MVMTDTTPLSDAEIARLPEYSASLIRSRFHRDCTLELNAITWAMIATIRAQQADIAALREALGETVKALSDLSFDCFSPIPPCRAPSVATYNSTFKTLETHRGTLKRFPPGAALTVELERLKRIEAAARKLHESAHNGHVYSAEYDALTEALEGQAERHEPGCPAGGGE